MPAGDGIRIERPAADYAPTKANPRAGYASGYAQNGWLLAPGSVVQCIDDFAACGC